MEEIHKGVFVCMSGKCKMYNIEMGYEWCCDWPLARRQQKCRACHKPMLFVKLKKTMTEAAKARLVELTARKKKEDEECRTVPAASTTADTASSRSASVGANPRRKKLVRRKRG